MRKMHDPEDLEVSAQPAENGKWKWTLSVGGFAPVKTGVVTGTRDLALGTARDVRLELIAKGKKV
jgi:hypothetical protein